MKVAILDFGSQFTQLIARRFRELNVYSELFPYDISLEELKKFNPSGIVLSGGPSSLDEEGAPKRSVKELQELAPILGVCYGMQMMVEEFGGKVTSTHQCEYGLSEIQWKQPLPGLGATQKVWMSHGDSVEKMPEGFELLAESDVPAAILGPNSLALQFHPEVTHTEKGDEILKYFAFEMCKMEPTWDAGCMLETLKERIQKQVPENEHVLCALSGGVDSTVVGTLLTEVLGSERVHCYFIDNGLLRKNEFEEVLGIYKSLGLNVKGIDAEKDFLDALAGVSDPETKRKIIGAKFIDMFNAQIECEKIQWLAQGTLYPDVIESVSLRGASVTIKSHHNVGGLPEDMNLKLVEPLRELFKDEVRLLGAALNIPANILGRHPFPGPGLAIRVMGKITKEDLDTLRDCDAIFIDELKSSGLYDQIWQAACIMLPVRTVGVQGDGRSYEKSLALRAVSSKDGMTADWFEFEPAFLKKVSNRITNEVKKINRVVYDITSKPPGTIEWE